MRSLDCCCLNVLAIAVQMPTRYARQRVRVGRSLLMIFFPPHVSAARRYAQAMIDATAGYKQTLQGVVCSAGRSPETDAPSGVVRGDSGAQDGASGAGELAGPSPGLPGGWIVERDLQVVSMCEHHLLPFYGTHQIAQGSPHVCVQCESDCSFGNLLVTTQVMRTCATSQRSRTCRGRRSRQSSPCTRADYRCRSGSPETLPWTYSWRPARRASWWWLRLGTCAWCRGASRSQGAVHVPLQHSVSFSSAYCVCRVVDVASICGLGLRSCVLFVQAYSLVTRRSALGFSKSFVRRSSAPSVLMVSILLERLQTSWGRLVLCPEEQQRVAELRLVALAAVVWGWMRRSTIRRRQHPATPNIHHQLPRPGWCWRQSVADGGAPTARGRCRRQQRWTVKSCRQAAGSNNNPNPAAGPARHLQQPPWHQQDNSRT